MAGSMYTYEDFLKELEGSGMKGHFSDADMRLAQAHPDAGMSILNYKRDYASATNDQARALANAGAERVRSSFGGYTGGTDGSQYYRNSLSPRDFTYKEEPTFQSRYDGQIQSLLQGLVSRPDFSYSAESDPLYSQYRKQYIREGQRASQDAMGQAAAMSGGMPSSYASTAAGQTANYYNAQLTDKIPELEQLAYQKYMNDFDMDRVKLGAVQDAENADYQKFLQELGQYNADRDFAYGQFSDMLTSQRQDQADAWSRAQTAADYGDYRGLNDLGVDTAEYISPQDQWKRELEYQLSRDAVSDRRYDDELAYQRGRDAVSDQRYADELAYQRERDARAEELERALYGAEYGDYSGLEAMGVDTSEYTNGGNASYKPRLTWEQVQEQVEAGNTGPQILRDYEYYTGQPYFRGIDESMKAADYPISGRTMRAEDLGDSARSIYNAIESKLGGLTKTQVLEAIQSAYDRGDINDSEFEFFAARYGIDE